MKGHAEWFAFGDVRLRQSARGFFRVFQRCGCIAVILNVRDAAARIGVSPSTFKRLCERHGVKVERTPGGHRRISLSALRELEVELGRPSGKRAAAEAPTVDQVVALLMEQAAFELGRRLLAACERPSDIASLCDEVLAPAMWRLGSMWQRGEIQVYEEHFCTETLLQSLDCLAPYVRQGGNPQLKAVGGCLGTGVDSVASKMVKLCLSSVGVAAVDLGPRVPTEEMAAASVALEADLIWSSHTHWDDREGTLAALTKLRELVPRETQMIIGGGGLSPSALQSLPWCQFFKSLTEMTAYVATQASRKQVA